jgi:hypothetical protein
MLMNCHIFETKPARWVDPGMKSGQVKEKIEERKTRQDPVKSPVATHWLLFFFTKTMSF